MNDGEAELRAAVHREAGEVDAWADTGARPSRGAGGEPAFPAAAVARYRPVRFLGQGGMGRVFLAYDPRLRRDVALKFVRGDDADLGRRFVAEARAQARVSHEHVCKVFEVDEVDGTIYIAMQYIPGESLGAVASQLSLEQKVQLVRGAALGVHEAHRADIIHRDIKPGNILVERTEDGALRPYVMDFGLARSAAHGDATATGAVLGTPHYMAPEQARGAADHVDRRTDVYALGATLYAVLAGEPPISGSDAVEVLRRIETIDPRPLRAFDPSIPEDLEATVSKCLEKEREARYDSARALADDLERFLANEPVRARPIGAWTRLRRRVAKERRVAAAVATALLVVFVALGYVAKTRRDASAREELARRFGEVAARIESMARYSALAPLHDVRDDRTKIRAQMDQLAREIRDAGPLGEGPGEYALGRGFLALDEQERARVHLEAAWAHGFRGPNVAHALAMVTGYLYQKELLQVERIRSEEQRTTRKRDIERRYRGPALAYLRSSQGAEMPSPDHAAALMAFYEDRLDDALGHLDAVGVAAPWFYEAHELRGDILQARAQRHRFRGEIDLAQSDLAAGRRAYAAARVIGESAPSIHEALAELEYGALVIELYGGGDVAAPFARGMDAIGRALTAMPDHVPSLLLEARFHRSLAEHRANQGGDVDDLLAKSIAAARRALLVDPGSVEARLELARSHRQWGEARENQHRDPRAELAQAVEISEGIAPSDRTYDFYVHLGLIWSTWADYDDQMGDDADANRGKSIEAYEKAIALSADRVDVWINLGVDYVARASRPRGGDPDADLDRAAAAIDRARSIHPTHVVPYFYGGRIHTQRAVRRRARGADPASELALARDLYEKGIAINPKLPHLHNGEGEIALQEARDAWDHGGDPGPKLDEARAAFDRAVAAAPEQGFAYHNLSEVLLHRARYAKARGADPIVYVRDAEAVVEKAVERMPDNANPWANLGAIHVVRAEYELDRAQDPASSLAAALHAVDEATKRNPRSATARLALAEAKGAGARALAARGAARASDFEAASRTFEEAVELAPEDQDARVAWGNLCRAWASWLAAKGEDPGPPLRRGTTLANELLGVRADWPDARALRASLTSVAAVARGPSR